MNGMTRPFCGWVSDHIGRENTLFIAFLLEGAGIWALWVYGHDPLLFVILGGIAFFAWGETASLFPTICTDTFGTKYATTNAALLYTAKGTASLLIPLASFYVAENGKLARRLHWRRRLFNVVAAFLALAVLEAAAAAGESSALGALKLASAFSSNLRPRPGFCGRTSSPFSMAGVSS